MIVAEGMITRGVAVISIFDAGYGAYRDIGRYTRGEVSGDYLAAKGGIRTAQVTIAVLLLNPEPASKVPLIAAEVVLVVADVGFDLVYDHVLSRRQTVNQRLLATIDRSERFHAIRHQLLTMATARSQGELERTPRPARH